ncbi:hypothetical protein LXL04_007414 [Taraxacum kok-saghyz]
MSWDEPQTLLPTSLLLVGVYQRSERREEIEPSERGRGFRSVAAGGIETEKGCGGGSCHRKRRWKRTVVAVGSSLVKVSTLLIVLFPLARKLHNTATYIGCHGRPPPS